MERSWLIIFFASLVAGLLANWMTFIPCGTFLLYIVPGVVAFMAGWYALDQNRSARGGILKAMLGGVLAMVGMSLGTGITATFVGIDPASQAFQDPVAWHEQMYLQGIQPKVVDILYFILTGYPQATPGIANPTTRAGTVLGFCFAAGVLPGLLAGLVGGLASRSASHI